MYAYDLFPDVRLVHHKQGKWSTLVVYEPVDMARHTLYIKVYSSLYFTVNTNVITRG